MSRVVMLAIAAIVSALAVGLGASVQGEEPSRLPLYYQDPDAKPFYSAGPKKTASGRDYLPVFEDSPALAPPASASALAAKPAGGGDHKILYYRNPMGLPDTSSKPKNDSMGMAYLPVYADENMAGDPPGTVRISPGKIQTLGVRTETVEMRPSVDRCVRATGIVQFDERHLATVTTKVAGWIERLAVSATGDPVRRGQVLAEIYSPDLVASEEEYLVAARLGGAITDASLQRLRARDVPEAEISRLRRTGRASRLIAITAPADGVVIDKPAQEGMRVGPGDPLYKTADLSTVWLIAQVQEQDLGAIQPGQVAKANFVAFPGRTFEGKVDFIYPTLSAETRTARVRIIISNPDEALRAAMYANVQIAATSSAVAVLAVPSSAVIDNGVRQVVLIDRGEGRFEPRRVQLGAHGDDWIQVIDGVAAGDKVVVGANFLIDAESNLRAALQGFSAGSNDKPQAAQLARSQAMIGRLIELSARNKLLILMATLILVGVGIWSVINTPLDALPDLSDTQVIVYTEYPGQAPQVVEDQVTYPLTTALLAVPHAKVVRGFSNFGLSFVYVVFEDGTDLYWARSRVLEYLNFAAKRLPRA